jgi:hypothetical protein
MNGYSNEYMTHKIAVEFVIVFVDNISNLECNMLLIIIESG